MTVKNILSFPLLKKHGNLLLIILAFLVLLGVYLVHVRKDMSDFGVCYQGGQRILKGETLYRVSDGHLQYKYSPASAVFFSILTFLPYEIAKLIWYFSQLVFFFLTLFLCYDLLPLKQKKRGTVMLLSFLILAKFLGREVELGQVNIFILFLLLLMVKASLERKEIKGGLIWAFSLYFKPYALVFFPYFILKKKLKLIASGLGMLILGFLLPAIFYGFEYNLRVLIEWPRTLSLSTPSLIDQYDNASLQAFLLKNLPSGQRGLAWELFILLAFLAGFFLLWMMLLSRGKGLKEPELLEFSYLFILIPLLSPLAWYYNYLYSALAIALLINFIDKFPRVLRYILIADFIFIGASLRGIMRKHAFRFYTQHSLVVVGFLVILAFLFYSRRKSIS
jgi:hypothetical protein